MKQDFNMISKHICCDNFLNKLQKRLYDKIVANQQISETQKALITFAIRLKTQLSQALRKYLDCKALYQHTDNSLNHKNSSFTQRSKSSNFRMNSELKKCKNHFSQKTSAD